MTTIVMSVDDMTTGVLIVRYSMVEYKSFKTKLQDGIVMFRKGLDIVLHTSPMQIMTSVTERMFFANQSIIPHSKKYKISVFLFHVDLYK